MKKPKTMADLLVVTNVCIEASGARAQLLDLCNKGPIKEEEAGGSGGIESSNPPSKKRRDRSIVLLTLRSGARSIAQGTL
jgi:hypothetical protein